MKHIYLKCMWLVIGLLLPVICFASTTITTPNELPWYSILPPIIAVLLAFITRHLLLSLGVAIIAGAFLVSIHQQEASYITGTLGNSANYLFANLTNSWNLKVLAFVIMILAMISVIIVSGGLKGIVKHLIPHARTARSSRFITFLAGLIVFIDDYANTMIVGSAMRPITDHYRVSREKLAFIIDATSAPVAGLAVISTWIGFEVGLFGDVSQSLSLGKDGYSMFFDALAFRFYCILMLLYVLMVIFLDRDFGPMLTAEKRSIESGKLQADDARTASSKSFTMVDTHEASSHVARTALIPFLVLFLVLIFGLWWDGNGWQAFQQNWLSVLSLQSWQQILANTENSTVILLTSASLAFLTAIMSGLLIANTPAKAILAAVISGVKSSLLPIMILLLAWSLKSTCDDLQTGEYLVSVLSPYLSPLWFPVLLFFVAALTAFGTGTSWGTMSILIPIAIPLAYTLDMQQYGLITVISLAAVLDGAIFGDHCSPISDTTIMSSIASDCDHLHHVKTQIPYSVLVATAAMICGYLPAAMGWAPIVSYILAACVLVLFLLKMGKRISITSRA